VPVTLVVECKRAPGKHWVTFPYEGGQISSQPVWHHALVHESDARRVQILEGAWRQGDTIFGPDPKISTALTEADLGRDVKDRSKEDDGGDLASKALRQVWSATQALLEESQDQALQTDGRTRILIPVIVTGAQLWAARLDDGGNAQVEKTEYARVRTPSTGSAVLVHVMGADRFATFAQQIAGLQSCKPRRERA
jgi:hypothetical protein